MHLAASTDLGLPERNATGGDRFGCADCGERRQRRGGLNTGVVGVGEVTDSRACSILERRYSEEAGACCDPVVSAEGILSRVLTNFGQYQSSLTKKSYVRYTVTTEPPELLG